MTFIRHKGRSIAQEISQLRITQGPKQSRFSLKSFRSQSFRRSANQQHEQSVIKIIPTKKLPSARLKIFSIVLLSLPTRKLSYFLGLFFFEINSQTLSSLWK